MPRQARLDIPGGLYHVIARGNERREIFHDDSDYKEFYKRTAQAIKETGQKCFAWAFIPNHYHLLILRGTRPLSDTMRKLMTGYTGYFNRRHHRAGHLFQDRYKAILCQKEDYLLELAAYIHLNPMRAGLVKRYKDLAGYRWCGHGEVLTGGTGLVMRDYLLEHFGDREAAAVKKYDLFVQERVGRYKRGEYSGGGLLRSAGGLDIAAGRARRGEKEHFDERVLGSGDFVASVLKELDAGEDREMDKDGVISEVLKLSGLRREDIFKHDRSPDAVTAKALYCYLMREKAGTRGVELMKELSLSSGAISHLCQKGRALAKGY
jgi:REP element-mobilizing transposase RayT